MEVHTAAVASSGTGLLIGALLHLAHRLLPEARGLQRASWAFALQAIGLLVYAWYPTSAVPSAVWPVPVSLTVLAVYGAQLAFAIQELVRAKAPSRAWWLLPWLVAASSGAGWLAPAWTWPGASIAQLLNAVLFGWCAALAWRAARRGHGLPLMLMAATLAVSALSFAGWALHLWVNVIGQPSRPVRPEELSMLAWNVMASMWLMLIGGVGFILAVLSQLVRQLVDASLTDPLTQVLNRRGLERRLRTLLADRTVAPSRLGVAVIDLDHFKRINDTHGHAAGDDVLVWCARRMGAALRGADILCRAGGEEFVVVVPDADAALTRDVAERLRAAIAQAPARVRAGGSVPVTVSIGVVGADASPTGFDRALELADAALYTAKQAGRNRVVVAEHPAGGAGGTPLAAPAA